MRYGESDRVQGGGWIGRIWEEGYKGIRRG